MPEIRIDPEFRGLLRPLTDEEFELLEAQILEEGCNDPLIVWDEEDILLDGHHSLEICQNHEINYHVARMTFDSRQRAIAWVQRRQKGRRNVAPAKESYERGKAYNEQKQSRGGDRKSKCHTDTLIGSTAEELAETHGVSPETIKRDAKFAEAVDAAPEDVREKVLNGELPRSTVTHPLCERCQRVGPVKGCPMCKEMRPAKKKANPITDDGTPPKDAFGNDLPRHCRDAYLDPWMQATIDYLGVTVAQFWEKRLADGLNKRKRHFPAVNVTDFVDGCGMAGNTLEQLLDHLKENRPAGVCPACKGKRCPECHMKGLVTRKRYAELKEAHG